MKILHIGDIHLGCTLDNLRRNPEIENVFRFLAGKVRGENIRAALLTGDIFDNGAPSGESQELYYDFLVNLQLSGCGQVVVTAGNHDNPNFLAAPGELLKRMNIHVVGCADPLHPEREVIPLGDSGNPEAFVCAVPYLRERDIRAFSGAGESTEEREISVARAVASHYRTVYGIADRMRNGRKIPIIGMGHLYAEGSIFGTEEIRKTAGNLNSVNLEDFAVGFDYMALGHIHKPQSVRGRANWRYAGSVLPMNLRTRMFPPQVVLVDTDDPSNPAGIELPEECFHKMRVISGNMEELRSLLNGLKEKNESIWVKPVYTGTTVLPNWSIELRQELRDSPVRLVFPEVRHDAESGREPDDDAGEEADLEALTPEQVFLAHLEQKGEITERSQKEALLTLFRQAQSKVFDPSEKRESGEGRENPGVMKFKRLFFKNVNSLYGEHLIDFEAPEFRRGIFLITGKTGSGKSSIFDAICAALYAWTPRCGGISQTKNCVMSEGSEEMISELTFSLGEKEYRAVFRQKRSPRGQKPFQPAKHRLFLDGKLVSEQSAETKEKIYGLIGMDKTQFSSCVLLAQGGFDAFLRADVKDRADILKQITATQHYTDIGIQINTEFGDVNGRYVHLNEMLGGISILPPEELEQLKARKAERTETLEKADAERKLRTGYEETFAAVEKERKYIQEMEVLQNRAQKAWMDAEEERIALRDANQAQNCQAAYDEFKNCGKEQQGAMRILASLEEDLPALEKNLRTASLFLADREAALERTGRKYEEQMTLFKEVRRLDSEIGEKEERRKAVLQDLAEAEAELKKERETFSRIQSEWDSVRKNSEEAEKYLAMPSHAGDSGLELKKDTWEIRREALVGEEEKSGRMEKELLALSDSLEKTEKNQADSLKRIRLIEEKCETLEQRILSERRSIIRLLNGKNREETVAAYHAAMKLDDFFRGEIQRETFLSPSEPCPLCGSREHPYCDGTGTPGENKFGQTAAELKKRLEESDLCEVRARSAEKLKAEAEKELSAERVRCENLTGRIAADSESLKSLSAALETARKNSALEAASLAGELRDFLQTEWTDHSSLPEILEERIRKFGEACKIVAALENEKKKFDAAASAFRTISRKLSETVESEKFKLKSLTEKLEELSRTRENLFGTKNVDREEKIIAGELKKSRTEKEAAVSAVVKAQEAVRHNKNDQQTGRNRLEDLKTTLSDLESGLKRKLTEFHFASTDEFLAKRMDPAQIQFLSGKMQTLEGELKTKNAVLAERLNLLAELKRKIPAEVLREDNLKKLEAAEHAASEIKNSVNEIELKLLSDKQARDRSAAFRKQLDDLRILHGNWKYLNDNFGSTETSDRFGRIAQGYTFRRLLHFANRNRLDALRSHFTLRHDDSSPLELCVVDHHRGNLIRTAKNLSGGERFEVSLALALGLAEMSAISQNARLGNVLLDEGFGTLDDETLDSALDLLMRLRDSDGKLVGIISHVGKLQDRIEAQIAVTCSGGMGTLSGAGVADPAKTEIFPGKTPPESAEMPEKKS